jgi:hypothetical protein
MGQLNTPSQSVLIYRDNLIRSVQELYETVSTLAERIITEYKSLFYEKLYVGIDADYTDILNDTYYHESVTRGKAIHFDTVTGYIWVVAPEEYAPVVAMSLVEVPMSLYSTISIEDVSYKVWKSEEEQTGSFNLYLF